MKELLDHPAVQAGVLPFVVALLIALPLARTRYLAAATGSGMVVLLALTVGFAVVPLTAVRKMMVLVLVAIAVALAIEAAVIPWRRTLMAVIALATGLATLWVLQRILQQAEGGAAWRMAIGATLFVGVLVASVLAANSDPLRASVIGAGLGWGSGVLAVLGASVLLGQTGIALGTACAAAALAQILRGGRAPAGWTTVLPAAIGTSLVGVLAVTNGQLQAHLLLPLLLVVPAACFVRADERKPWLQATLQGLAALVPVVVAITWAWFDAQSASPGG